MASVCVAVLVAAGCDDNKDVEDNGHGKPSSPQALANTKWKLVGIIDAETGKIKELKPKDCEECYTITFDTDTTAVGNSIINEVYLKILGTTTIVVGCGTMVFECDEDDICGLYCDALRTVESYIYSNNELIFFFDNNRKYLLYKQIER